MWVRSAVAGGVALACASVGALMTAADATPGGGGGGGGHKPDRCVTQDEYDAVDVNMPRKVVHKHFGTPGHRTSITHNRPRATEVRSYDVCDSPDSTVTVTYEKGPHGPFKLQSKTAVWVA